MDVAGEDQRKQARARAMGDEPPSTDTQQMGAGTTKALWLHGDNGKENGSYYGILGLYKDNVKYDGNYNILFARPIRRQRMFFCALLV